MEQEIAYRISQLDLIPHLALIPMAWVILAISPFVGSFLGLLAQRIPQNRGVIFGGSECEHCGRRLGFLDLIPVASWLLLGGRCRYCGARIGYFPLVMELAALGVAAWAITETSVWILAATCLFGWWLLLLATIDWRVFLLPDVLTLPLAVTGIAISYALDPASLPNHLIGGFAGFTAFATLAFAYSRLRGREGLGLGDAKLMGALGAWLGWQGLASALLMAAVAGLIFVLSRSAIERRLAPTDPIPFGTFLALGGWLVWLYGPLIFQAP
jgi:leader peptidase (prepilin peptidase)/N-methyltransferase